MHVDDEVVLRLAKLARLEVSGKRADALRHDLDRILAMVDKLDELDLDGVAPLRYVIDVEEAARPDQVGEHLDRDLAMANAVQADPEEGFFLVPKVIP